MCFGRGLSRISKKLVRSISLPLGDRAIDKNGLEEQSTNPAASFLFALRTIVECRRDKLLGRELDREPEGFHRATALYLSLSRGFFQRSGT